MDRHLTEARSFLEAAVAAGYSNARIVTDLAFICAIVDGPHAADIAMRSLHANPGVDWSQAVKLCAEHEPHDIYSRGFVLGMDQSAVWTRLGTFVLTFMKDRQFAKALYRTAESLGPNDPVALTNLARLLVSMNTNEGRLEAERLLQRAQNFADRRFIWWRVVLMELEEQKRKASGESDPGELQSSHSYSAIKFPSVVNLSRLKQQFRTLELDPELQERGYELERLVYELARLTFGTAAPPCQIERDARGVIRKIDGFFRHESDRYRVECKWKSNPASQNDVLIFRNKLDVVGISGLFISISGFRDTAIAQAREYRNERAILLMDGSEVRAVFGGLIRFDDVMTKKRRYFDLQSTCFYPVLPVAELAR